MKRDTIGESGTFSVLDEKKIFSDERDKHFMAIVVSAMITLLGTIMTIVCNLQGNMFLTYVSVGYGVLFLACLILLHVSKKFSLKFFYFASYLVLYALEILYIFNGGQEGFGILWILMFPTFSLFMISRTRYFIALNSIALGILILFFWTPLFNFCWEYSNTFRIRYPLLFLIITAFTMVLKIRMGNSEKNKKLIFSQLMELQGNLKTQVENKTIELKNERDKSEKLTLELAMALTATIDAKDKYTSGHSVRVARYSRLLAGMLGKSEEEQEKIYLIGLLHDIGKIGVPDEIINKTSRLNDDEYAKIKAHCSIGYDIVKNVDSMPEIQIGVRWHHERFDGTGYPDGKKGYDIPEFARIISVADTYDAMTSNRSYRKLLDQKTVRDEFEKGKGTQFDPEIAQKMIELIDNDVEYVMHG